MNRMALGWRCLALAAALLAPLAAVTAPLHDGGTELLGEISRRLDPAPVVRGEFEQTKTLKGFKRPLVSRGGFVMARGQGIEWTTREPFPTNLIVTRERLITRSNGATQQLDTRQEPGLRAVNELLLALLGGDMKALAARFAYEGVLDGAQGWRLSLSPRDPTLARFIIRVDLEGSRYVTLVHLQEASGDDSVIRFNRPAGGQLTASDAALFR